MTVKYDYSTQDIIDSNFIDTQSFVDAVVKQSLPLLPVEFEMPSFGCSVYRAVNDEGDFIMGRNLQLLISTFLVVVAAIAISFTDIAGILNLAKLPVSYLKWIAILLIAYVLVIEIFKKVYVKIKGSWL